MCITLKVLPHFNDKKLEDGSRTLTDFKITNLTTLDMVLMSDAEHDDHYHNRHKIVINAPVMGLRGGGKRATIDDLLFMMFSSMFS